MPPLSGELTTSPFHAVGRFFVLPQSDRAPAAVVVDRLLARSGRALEQMVGLTSQWTEDGSCHRGGIGERAWR